MKDHIAVLIPCYNESRTIEKVVRDFRRVLPEAVVYVYDNNSKLYFSSNSSSTKISNDGDIEVDVIKLDDFFKAHEAPTFIKMDIEGAELAALKGCAETISRYKPKLAICVYHKPEDIFEIPEYILSLNPDYKMYLRHYTNLVNETVLYCE